IGRRGGDRCLDVARGRLHRLLHLAQLVQLHGAVDLRLHVVDVALRLAQERAHRAGHARQLLRPDDDEGHGADERHLGQAEVEHLGRLQDLLRASTSIVVWSAGAAAGPCEAVTWLAGGTGVSGCPPSFMPSLKPLTAPPRSEPMFFSFLVPKTSTTINSTTNQCQMENEPMELLLSCLTPILVGQV